MLLIGTILQVIQHLNDCTDESTGKEVTRDEQHQTLAEITVEFLADICIQIPKVKSVLLCWIRSFALILIWCFSGVFSL